MMGCVWAWRWWFWFVVGEGEEEEEEEDPSVLAMRLRSVSTAVGMYPTAAHIRALVVIVNWGISDTGRSVIIWMSSLLRWMRVISMVVLMAVAGSAVHRSSRRHGSSRRISAYLSSVEIAFAVLLVSYASWMIMWEVVGGIPVDGGQLERSFSIHVRVLSYCRCREPRVTCTSALPPVACIEA